MPHKVTVDIKADDRNTPNSGLMHYYHYIKEAKDKDGLRHTDDCIEAHALGLVLARYDKETRNAGDYCLKNLSENYGLTIEREQLVDHLTHVENYFSSGNHAMSRMFDLVLARLDEEYLRSLFQYHLEDRNPKDVFSDRKSLIYGFRYDYKPSNRYLMELESKLLDYMPKDKIYCPYSGYAFWSIDAFSANNSNKLPLLFFQDNDPIAVGMASANAIIHNIRLGLADCSDALKKSLGSDFDHSLINHVFAGSSKLPKLNFHYKAFENNPEMIPLSQAYESTRSGGNAIVMCSTSSLYKKNVGMEIDRFAILYGTYVKAVIELPGFLLSNASDSAALVIMSPFPEREHSDYSARMINGVAYAKWYREAIRADISSFSQDYDKIWKLPMSAFIDSLVDLYRDGKTDRPGAEAFVKDVLLTDILEDQCNMCPSHYVFGPEEDTRFNKEASAAETNRLLAECEDLIGEIEKADTAFRQIAKRLVVP